MNSESWVERSHREAAALCSQAQVTVVPGHYGALLDLVAAAYREGAIAGLQVAQEIFGEKS